VATHFHDLPWEFYSTRQQWLNARPTYIGASEAAAIMGRGRYGSPFSVWKSKTYPSKGRGKTTIRLRKGLVMEQLAAELYVEWAHRKGLPLRLHDPGQYTILRHPEYPFIGATLDRIAETREYMIDVEFKDTHQFMLGEWANGIPLQFQVQLQHQMLCSGLDWAHIGVIVSLDDQEEDAFRVYTMQRNQRFIDKMLERLIEFWSMVQTKTQPKVDAHKATTQALRDIYPQETEGKVLEPTDEQIVMDLHRADQMYMEAKATVKAMSFKEAEAKNRIRAVMEDASMLRIPKGGTWTWKSDSNGTRVLRRK